MNKNHSTKPQAYKKITQFSEKDVSNMVNMRTKSTFGIPNQSVTSLSSKFK